MIYYIDITISCQNFGVGLGFGLVPFPGWYWKLFDIVKILAKIWYQKVSESVSKKIWYRKKSQNWSRSDFLCLVTHQFFLSSSFLVEHDLADQSGFHDDGRDAALRPRCLHALRPRRHLSSPKQVVVEAFLPTIGFQDSSHGVGGSWGSHLLSLLGV